jgi:hypothetical protein
MREMIDPLSTGRAWSRAGGVGSPVDLYETAEAVIIRMAVPGAEGTSLALTIEDEHVTLRGETPGPGSQWGERTVAHWQETRSVEGHPTGNTNYPSTSAEPPPARRAQCSTMRAKTLWGQGANSAPRWTSRM